MLISWNWYDLSEATQVECPVQPILAEIVTKVIGRFIFGKAAGLSGNIAKMLLPAEEAASYIQERKFCMCVKL